MGHFKILARALNEENWKNSLQKQMATYNIMCRKAIVSVFKEGKLVLIYKTMSYLEQIIFDDVLSLSESQKEQDKKI